MPINVVNQSSTVNMPYSLEGTSNDSEVNSSCDIKIKNIEKSKTMDKEQLDKSINKLNKFLKNEKVHAEYSVHKDFGTIMIKIIDDNTKDVLMEVPPEKILDMIASMCKQAGILDKKA